MTKEIEEQLRRMATALEKLANNKNILYIVAIVVMAIVAIVAIIMDTTASELFIENLFKVIPQGGK